jgi:hypothetical protein
MATSVSNDVKGLDVGDTHFSTASEPWLTRAEWIWTLFGLGLLITFLRFALDHS